MRYAIALAAAALLIAFGVAYVQQTNRLFEQRFRQTLREAKAAGNLPPEIDAEHADLANFGVDLPPSDVLRLKFAHFLVAWRFVLIGIVLLSSLGIARILRRRSPRPQSASPK